MEDRKLTNEQVLEITINLLRNIEVPAVLSEKIGIPIARCADNIQICLESMRAAERKAAESEDAEVEEKPQ